MQLNLKFPLLCIDPGTTHSGVVVFNGKNIMFSDNKYPNNELIKLIAKKTYEHLAIEGISSQGMAVGKTVFETVEWIGRFREAFGFENTTRIFRKDIKMFICNSMRSNDSNIRTAIIDMFPSTGGGKIPQIGVKNNSGPLYGISTHAWSALAVGITYHYSKKGSF